METNENIQVYTVSDEESNELIEMLMNEDLDNFPEETFVSNENTNPRRIFLTKEIDVNSVNPIIRDILRFNEEDYGLEVIDREPIILYISSPGGDLTACFGLCGVIEASKTPIITVNCGSCESAALLIFISGTIRYSFKYSTFLMHEGSVEIKGCHSQFYDFYKFDKQWSKRVKNFVLECTTMTDEKYEEVRLRDWYFMVDKALKYGFVDKVIGEDCGIDEVL